MSHEPSKSTKKQRQALRRQKKEAEGQAAALRAEKRKLLGRIGLWSCVLLGLVAIVLGLLFITDPDRSGVSWLRDRDAIGEWTLGNRDAKISLVEYSDFECPACARYHKYVKRLIEEEGNNVQYTFRHFPLKMHKIADLAAVAAEAAGRQGKFWDMQDRLFRRQKEWRTLERQTAEDLFVDYAGLLALDTVQFERDLRSRELLDKVWKDLESGMGSGVKGTPAFFLNGRKMDRNPRKYEDFKDSILNYASNPP